MAEVSGLVLGTVALASLFSTCVDLFDCFELGRNYAYDYHLACTKVGLLKARLSAWGLSLGVDKPGYEHPTLRHRWAEEHEVISRSLYGIEEIFKNASLLAEKYRLVPERSLTTIRSAISQQVSTPLPSGPDHATGPPKRSASAWALLRKRTTWAIHDKQKFDRFIQDLGFLIENLEKVAERAAAVPATPKTDPALVKPPHTPRPGWTAPAAAAVGAAASHDPSTKSKDVPHHHRPVQPAATPTPTPATYVHGKEKQLYVEDVALKLDGDVFTGSQRTRGGVIVMGSVGDSDRRRRNLYSGNQTATRNGFAVMGNVSLQAALSLQESNRVPRSQPRPQPRRVMTISESDESTASDGGDLDSGSDSD